jgi:glycosyltransferase involved in cell wall biosynthesis
VRIRFFGSYHKERVARISVLLDGLRENGCVCEEMNVRINLSHEQRLRMLRAPWRVTALPFLLLHSWWQLTLRTIRAGYVDAVLVPYMGHFDVLLARILHPRTPIILDHLVSAADTAEDRRASPLAIRALTWLDRFATLNCDIVMLDTEQQRVLVCPRHAHKIVVVPVGAPRVWHDVVRPTRQAGPLSLIFFGLFTPLQGTPEIARALRIVAERGILVLATFIGRGQDLTEVQTILANESNIRWLDWLDDRDLMHEAARHDVCLGIFGTGSKARRVVPQKLYLGAAAGCALLTSATVPQTQAFGDSALYAEAGNAQQLADRIAELAGSPELLCRQQQLAKDRALARFVPSNIAATLKDAVNQTVSRRSDASVKREERQQ